MPFLNFNYGFLVFEDVGDRSPKIRVPDISLNVNQIPVGHDKTNRITLNPGESETIVTTARALGSDSTTQIQFYRPVTGSDNMRVSWNGSGANPVFRTKMAIAGGASTVVSISRVTPYVARVQVQSGTAWSLGTVNAGDYIKFEATTPTFTSPFSVQNQGQVWQVQAKGSDYIDFIDNGIASLDSNITLGASFDFALRVMSSGPVRIGDILELAGTVYNPSNVGKFQIVAVSPEYVEIVNPFGHEQTVTLSTSTIIIYDNLIGFVNVRATGTIQIRYDAQVEWSSIGKVGEYAHLLGTVSAYKIEAKNNGLDTIVVWVQHCSVG